MPRVGKVVRDRKVLTTADENQGHLLRLHRSAKCTFQSALSSIKDENAQPDGERRSSAPSASAWKRALFQQISDVTSHVSNNVEVLESSLTHSIAVDDRIAEDGDSSSDESYHPDSSKSPGPTKTATGSPRAEDDQAKEPKTATGSPRAENDQAKEQQVQQEEQTTSEPLTAEAARLEDHMGPSDFAEDAGTIQDVGKADDKIEDAGTIQDVGKADDKIEESGPCQADTQASPPSEGAAPVAPAIRWSSALADDEADDVSVGVVDAAELSAMLDDIIQPAANPACAEDGAKDALETDSDDSSLDEDSLCGTDSLGEGDFFQDSAAEAEEIEAAVAAFCDRRGVSTKLTREEKARLRDRKAAGHAVALGREADRDSVASLDATPTKRGARGATRDYDSASEDDVEDDDEVLAAGTTWVEEAAGPLREMRLRRKLPAHLRSRFDKLLATSGTQDIVDEGAARDALSKSMSIGRQLSDILPDAEQAVFDSLATQLSNDDISASQDSLCKMPSAMSCIGSSRQTTNSNPTRKRAHSVADWRPEKRTLATSLCTGVERAGVQRDVVDMLSRANSYNTFAQMTYRSALAPDARDAAAEKRTNRVQGRRTTVAAAVVPEADSQRFASQLH